MELIDWLRRTFKSYTLEPIAVYRMRGSHAWPLVASNEQQLKEKLESGGHFLALPKEPAALANVLEVSLVDFMLAKLGAIHGVRASRGTERGYPDVEVTGGPFGDSHFAVDVKVARRNKNGKQTQSRITLYTGNTYFRYPDLKWAGTFRPFCDYTQHIDVIALYTLNESTLSRVDKLEVVVQEPWRIGSKQRSSTTREYLGAVTSIDDLRNGKGEFSSMEEFYRYWTRFPFKIGRAVQQRLDRLLREQRGRDSIRPREARAAQRKDIGRRHTRRDTKKK